MAKIGKKNMKPIKINIKLKGGEGSVIPKGIVEELIIFVRDGSATYKFNDTKTTKKFAQRQNTDGVPTKYVERIQSAVSIYEGMSQQDLVKHIMTRIKELEKK